MTNSMLDKKGLVLQVVLMIVFLFVFIGCGTHVKHYKSIKKCLDQKKYQKPPNLVKKAREEGIYEKKDRVLYYLDLGLAHHYASCYKQSNENLERAEQYMRELYTKSISKKGWSLLTNNNQLPYYGEEYENLYINVFKALNYVQLNEPKEAFVEIRDMYEKISYMEQKYEKKEDKYKSSTLKRSLNDKVKKAMKKKRNNLEINKTFSNSALGRYFNYTMYTSSKDWNDARISFKNMREAFIEQKGIYNFPFPRSVIQPQPEESEKAIVHSIALLGHGPVKEQQEIRMPIPSIGFLKFVMPELKPRGTSITSVRLFQDDKLVARLQKMEDVNRVAEAVFRMKKPLILYKNLFRTVSKEIGGEVAAQAAEEAGGNAAELAADIATAIYTEVSEQADLRTTRLLPGVFRVASFYLPHGRNHLQAKFYSDGRVVRSKKINLYASSSDFNIIELVSFQ